MIIMEAFFDALWFMEIQSNIANPLALEQKQIGGVPTTENPITND